MAIIATCEGGGGGDAGHRTVRQTGHHEDRHAALGNHRVRGQAGGRAVIKPWEKCRVYCELSPVADDELLTGHVSNVRTITIPLIGHHIVKTGTSAAWNRIQ